MHVKGWIYKHTHTHTHTLDTLHGILTKTQWGSYNERHTMKCFQLCTPCNLQCVQQNTCSFYWIPGRAHKCVCVCIHTWASLCAYTDTNGLGVLCRAGVLFLLFSCSVVSDIVTLRTAAHQASLPFSSFGVCSNSHPLSWWCHQIPTFLLIVVPGSHLILCCLFTDDKEESDSWAYNNTNPIVILM